jgi:CheY-like chemotaxis protein
VFLVNMATILVVDDDAHIREVARFALAREGYGRARDRRPRRSHGSTGPVSISSSSTCDARARRFRGGCRLGRRI